MDLLYPGPAVYASIGPGTTSVQPYTTSVKPHDWAHAALAWSIVPGSSPVHLDQALHCRAMLSGAQDTPQVWKLSSRRVAINCFPAIIFSDLWEAMQTR